MITAVDTSILLDLFTADKQYGDRSAAMLRRCLAEGSLRACEVVWTETATVFPESDSFLESMKILGIEYSPMEIDAALHAAASWRRYRERGGRRTRVIADFLIGAHALMQCDRLLTRDRGFYRDYFSRLRVLDPASS